MKAYSLSITLIMVVFNLSGCLTTEQDNKFASTKAKIEACRVMCRNAGVKEYSDLDITCKCRENGNKNGN